ncbi:MAG: nucleotide exchange factor GrpE [Amphiplicatus sp.]
MSKSDYEPNDGQESPKAPASPEDAGPDLDRSAAGDEEKRLGELAELNDRVLRLAAELENTRRRAEREKGEASRYAITSFARDLLSVADAFDRALDAAPDPDGAVAPETLSAFITGLKMTDKELHAALERHGVRKISPRGEKFDPNLHQAVAQAPGAAPAGHVLDVAQPGFVIGDRVLRAAMVVVSTGPGAPSDGEEPQEPGARLDTRA